MRIALDYTAGIRQGAGVGQYVRSLVRAMLAQDSENQYTLLTSGRPTAAYPLPSAPNVRGRSVPIPDRYLNILWYRVRFPLQANYFTGPIDLYHGLDFVLPPLSSKLRTIVTVHDLAFLEHPETAVPELAAYLNRVVPAATERADRVVAVSETTRQALIKHYHLPSDKIQVVPCGVGPQFQRQTSVEMLEETRRKFALSGAVILSVGTLEPRKNHLGLLRAFAELCSRQQRPLTLAIAGGQGWMYEETRNAVDSMKLGERVRFLGRVSEADLIALYSLADVFAFPSFFEGFGMPPLEALACGTPVLTSNCSSLPEAVGEAALLVDPHDIHAIAAGLQRLLEDQQLCADLRQKGYVQAQRYTWERAAQRMLAIYEQLGQGNTQLHQTEHMSYSV